MESKQKTQEASCDMCLETKQTRYFDLYISGSEGTRLCADCENLIVQLIRNMRMIAFRQRKAEHIERWEETKE